MSNKYLEKIALSFGHAAAMGGSAALVGAGGYYRSKEEGQDHPALGAVRGSIAGAILGNAVYRLHKIRKLTRAYAPRQENIKVHIKNVGASHEAKTKEEVKRAYKRTAMKTHPDRRPPHEREAAEEEFKKLQDSWDKVQKSDWFNKLAFVNPYILKIASILTN